MSNRNYDKLAAAADQNVKEKDYWLHQLSGELVKTCFPYDHKNNINPVEMHDMRLFFTQDLSTRLIKLSKGSDVKLNMILTAILVLLLNKYTGHNDIIIAAPIYKQEADIDFINTILSLRTQIQESTTFKELLLQIRKNLVQATENQNYPIEILLEQLGISNHGKDFPLFDVVILQENIHEKKYLRHINYNMLFAFKRTGESIDGVVDYNSQLYEKTTIERLIHHYRQLLPEVFANMDAPVRDIDILSDEERKKILYDFNDTQQQGSKGEMIHELFAKQVDKTPDRVALVSEELLHDFQLTYKELNNKSHRLACFLRDRGVKPGIIVGLMVEKSLEMMMGILGILKAGGAYLPIDVAYPPVRIEYMLKESSAKILLTYARNTLTESFTGDSAKAPEIVDIFSPAVNSNYNGNITAVNRLEDPAYIIYTSGSTGKPKGVIVEHRNLVAYLQAFRQEFEITAEDTTLQQASYSFDAFVEEVYPVLSRGGKAAICPKYVIMDTRVLHRFILKHDITFISVSPLLLNEINQLPDTGRIRVFISGGDELKKEYITNLLDKGSVYNTYGPTEATVCATYHRCSPDDHANPPIGKPITNYQVTIMDSNHRLTPIGVPGELYIDGPGVTRGYLNRPELTAEKFCLRRPGGALFEKSPWQGRPIIPPGPPRKNFSLTVPGKGDYRSHRSYRSYFSYLSYTYRTGDLARWLPNGNIEFLGRIDNQINIRGFRVELGEIENHLLKHKDVNAALVLPKEIDNENSEPGDHRHLCAYIAGRKELSIPGLKEYLSTHLPDYMIPSFYVLLERMPMTPNGKPDIKALDSYKPISAAQAEYIAPTTETEKIISGIWEELLNLEKIGIHDNFFDIGGNSMLLLKATNKLREAFNFKGEIPFMLMFQHTTIDSLSRYLDREDAVNLDLDKHNQQAETLNKGKNRMKKLIKNK
jgi:amino acid adenylation domain-containing protein